MEEAEKGAKKNDKRNVAKDDVVLDMDYFKSRVKTEWSDSKSSEEDDNEEEEEKEFRKVNEEEEEVWCEQSNHVILVKNLPYGSTDGELAKMFGKFGNLEKVVLPPTKTLALVVFLEPADTRAAFKGTSATRYLDGPLYLEWAPGNVLSPSSTTESIEKNNAVAGEHDVKRVMLEQYVGGIADVDADPDRVEVKKHLKNGKNISMGFGFLEFDSVETATNVCRDLQIKSLRLPMKFGQHRGFAFVEFITKQEAENALEALLSTHLYGRHLVLERAKEGESLEEVRAKTAAQFADEQNGVSRKRKHVATSDEGKFKFERLD
ncbi:RNA-binding protein 19 [Pyrus ussuriensis x Pyrus communis]|uniref:RNA-binding protein 19 n=1 Tax=Pyrus ussuriensis x Pyrus communis TaxID=2448454 RepID=A0A5N5IBU7_9ROSA|nr:RNA-binding protein 19 [Pyrus ussuriensis x Pyrus communis]